jgi:predicted RecB family nuclease
LDADPLAERDELPPLDPAAQQRIADAATHRAKVLASLVGLFPGECVEISQRNRVADREAATLVAIADHARFVINPQLPRDVEGGRYGRIDAIMFDGTGYVPILVVRHKIIDPGRGALTSPVWDPVVGGGVDLTRKVRSQPRDQMRLAHTWRMLESLGSAGENPFGGVIGMDPEIVLWYNLTLKVWQGNKSALTEYDERFADRLAVANAAANLEPALAEPSRILECKYCPWWQVCEPQLIERRDVSLVARGDDAVLLRDAQITTIDQLAEQNVDAPLESFPNPHKFVDAVIQARAWRAGLSMIRRGEVEVSRGEVEVDVDMESFGDDGAYLWGCWVSGDDMGEAAGYRSFATWEQVPTQDEGRSFGEFWQWLMALRAKTKSEGLTFRAYCYNELAENKWMYASADRFAGMPGVPTAAEIKEFVESDDWIDLFRAVSEQFLCVKGKGLKVVAPVAGFHWRDPEASGENSMRWYRDAVGMDGNPRDDAQRTRILEYNEDDVRATHALRRWMTERANVELPLVSAL